VLFFHLPLNLRVNSSAVFYLLIAQVFANSRLRRDSTQQLGCFADAQGQGRAEGQRVVPWLGSDSTHRRAHGHVHRTTAQADSERRGGAAGIGPPADTMSGGARRGGGGTGSRTSGSRVSYWHAAFYRRRPATDSRLGQSLSTCATKLRSHATKKLRGTMYNATVKFGSFSCDGAAKPELIDNCTARKPHPVFVTCEVLSHM